MSVQSQTESNALATPEACEADTVIEWNGRFYPSACGGYNHYVPVNCGTFVIGQIYPGRPAPFRVDKNGVPIAWVASDAFTIPGVDRSEFENVIRVGMSVTLKPR